MDADPEKQAPSEDAAMKTAPGEAGKPGKRGGILMDDGTIVPHSEPQTA